MAKRRYLTNLFHFFFLLQIFELSREITARQLNLINIIIVIFVDQIQGFRTG